MYLQELRPGMRLRHSGLPMGHYVTVGIAGDLEKRFLVVCGQDKSRFVPSFNDVVRDDWEPYRTDQPLEECDVDPRRPSQTLALACALHEWAAVPSRATREALVDEIKELDRRVIALEHKN